MSLPEEYGRIKALWDSGHPDRAGIWMSYEDHIFEECLTMLDEKAGRIPVVGTVNFGPLEERFKMPPNVVKFSGGASRSERKPDYSLVNQVAVEAIAERMTAGAVKHGRHNYRGGDTDFVLETANHLLDHVLQFIAGDTSDNHLNAIGANFNILAWYRANKPETFAVFDDSIPHHGA